MTSLLRAPDPEEIVIGGEEGGEDSTNVTSGDEATAGASKEDGTTGTEEVEEKATEEKDETPGESAL